MAHLGLSVHCSRAQRDLVISKPPPALLSSKSAKWQKRRPAKKLKSWVSFTNTITLMKLIHFSFLIPLPIYVCAALHTLGITLRITEDLPAESIKALTLGLQNGNEKVRLASVAAVDACISGDGMA